MPVQYTWSNLFLDKWFDLALLGLALILRYLVWPSVQRRRKMTPEERRAEDEREWDEWDRW